MLEHWPACESSSLGSVGPQSVGSLWALWSFLSLSSNQSVAKGSLSVSALTSCNREALACRQVGRHKGWIPVGCTGVQFTLALGEENQSEMQMRVSQVA